MNIKIPLTPIAAILPFAHHLLTGELSNGAATETQPEQGFAAFVLKWAHHLLNIIGLPDVRADLWDRWLIFGIILLVAYGIGVLSRHVIIPIVERIMKHSQIRWDKILFKRQVFHRILELLPPITVLSLLELAFPPSYQHWYTFFEKACEIYLIIVITRILTALLGSIFDYYLLRQNAANSPYKSALEMSQLLLKALMVLGIAGTLMNMNLKGMITGLSAFAALLVLVFKDTLLGFIAGMQLVQNQMIHIGDWIVVSGTLANGRVEEINILTVRIRNHDNSFYYVPAYTLLTHSFQNWAGMKESGIRRVNTTLSVDVTSIHALKPDDVKTIMEQDLLTKDIAPGLLDAMRKDWQDWAAKGDAAVNNLTLFRLWLNYFLRSHKDVEANPYIIIRMLPYAGNGYVIELYFWLNTTLWADFETKQSNIMEEVVILLPLFHLQLFQLREALSGTKLAHFETMDFQ